MASLGNGVLLFGGTGNTGALGDTWFYDGTTWTQILGPQPQSRYSHRMVAVQGGVLMFGGLAASGADLGDTWRFNGTQWQQVALTGPGPRREHAMATIPSSTGAEEVLLFGGVTNSASLNDTWIWSGGAWSPRSTTSQPAAMFGNWGLPMAFDAYRRRVVLVDALGHATGNTWEWSGTDWLQRGATLGLSAPSRVPATFVNLGPNSAPGRMVAIDNGSTFVYGAVNPGRMVTSGTSMGPRVQIDPAFGDVLWRGESMTLRATGFAATGSVPQLVISAARYQPPLDLSPFGAPGYFLYADPNFGVTVPTAFAPATGIATFSTVVPVSTALLSNLYFQFYQFAPGANALNLVFTDLATGTVGAK